jgi:hypothetical protein
LEFELGLIELEASGLVLEFCVEAGFGEFFSQGDFLAFEIEALLVDEEALASFGASIGEGVGIEGAIECV